jgi:hypothetical protein
MSIAPRWRPGRGRGPGAPAIRRPALQRRKYQALVTLLPQAPKFGTGTNPSTWRAVVRARHHQTRASEFLTALVSSQGDAVQPGDKSIVTLVVVDRNPGDCLDVGDQFTLWRGSDIGRGVITRRLFV